MVTLQGKSSRKFLTQAIKFNITINETYGHVPWTWNSEKGTTSRHHSGVLVINAEPHSTSEQQTGPNEGHSIQKTDWHSPEVSRSQRQGQTTEPSQIGGNSGDMTPNAMWDPGQDPWTAKGLGRKVGDMWMLCTVQLSSILPNLTSWFWSSFCDYRCYY